MQLKRKIVKFVKFVTAFDPGHNCVTGEDSHHHTTEDMDCKVRQNATLRLECFEKDS